MLPSGLTFALIHGCSSTLLAGMRWAGSILSMSVTRSFASGEIPPHSRSCAATTRAVTQPLRERAGGGEQRGEPKCDPPRNISRTELTG